MKETDRFYFFWQHQFGQWTLRDMVDPDGTTYNCCEQYMMAKKALLFGDSDTYHQIMAASGPQEQKDLGRQVKGYDQTTWDQHKLGIVWYGNYLKFSQHADLKQRLLKTGDKILAEASPVDLIWGIGFTDKDPQALEPDKWRGQNLLGEVLMSLRATLSLC